MVQIESRVLSVGRIALVALGSVAYLQCLLGIVGFVLKFYSPEWDYRIDSMLVLQTIALIAAASLLLVTGFNDRRTMLFGFVALVSATAFAGDGLDHFFKQASFSSTAVLGVIKLDALFPYFFWRFARVFPQSFIPRKLDLALDWIVVTILSIGVILIAANVLDFINPEIAFVNQIADSNPNNLYEVLVYGLAFPVFFLLLFRMRSAREDERRRVRVFMFGLLGSLLPLLLFIIVTSISESAADFVTSGELRFFIIPSMQSFVIAIPIITTYAVLVERVLPVRILLKQAIRYTLGNVFVLVGIAFPIILFIYYLYSMRSVSIVGIFDGPNSLFLIAALGLSLFLLSRRREAYEYLERLFYRAKYDTNEALSELSEGLRNSSSLREVSEKTLRTIDETLHPEIAHLLFLTNEAFLQDPREALSRFPLNTKFGMQLVSMEHIADVEKLKETLEEKDKRFLLETQARYLIPVKRRSSNCAILLVGRKKSELPFTSTDVNFLQLVANTISLGYANIDEPTLLDDDVQVAYQCEECGRLYDVGEKCSACGSLDFGKAVLPRVLHGHYEVSRQIGVGGMAAVYLADDVRLSRLVVLKSLISARSDEHAFLREEARLMATFSHQNIATIYGYETFHSIPILVCEYLENGTLLDVLSDGYLKSSEVVEIVECICDALVYLHGRGIVHGDIKPSNIGFDSREIPKLLDFGLAGSRAQSNDSATVASEIGGTCAYLSPEQVRDVPVDQRADLWALAVTMYQAMYGSNPFLGSDIQATLGNIVRSDEIVAGCSAPRFFTKALSSNILDRPQTAAEFIRLLKQEF